MECCVGSELSGEERIFNNGGGGQPPGKDPWREQSHVRGTQGYLSKQTANITVHRFAQGVPLTMHLQMCLREGPKEEDASGLWWCVYWYRTDGGGRKVCGCM